MTLPPLQELMSLLYNKNGPLVGLLPELASALPDVLVDDLQKLAEHIKDAKLQEQVQIALLARLRAGSATFAAPPEAAKSGNPTKGARARELLQQLSEPVRVTQLGQWLNAIRSLQGGTRHVSDLPTMAGDKQLARPGDPGRPPQATRGRPPAIVNTGFVTQAEPAAALKSTMPLERDRDYYFWLEVGELLAESIETQATALPVELLPEEARLTVALFGFGDGLTLNAEADSGELQVRGDGRVVVARQPMGAHAAQIPVEPGQIERRLFFPLRTPPESGTMRLRCNIYYQQILVQSRIVRAKVMQQPAESLGALRSTADYTLSRRLDPSQLTKLQPHALSLMLNSNGDGSHGFRFMGQGEFKNEATLDAELLGELIRLARGALRRAAWGDEEPYQQGKSYRYGGARNLEQLKADLKLFAIRGYRFYDSIINRLSGSAQAANQLADVMGQPGLVQIALKESARLILPAALIYDYPLDTSDDRALSFCPAWLASLDGATPLEETDCFKGRCPSKGDDLLICPSGFWGYRHSIGMPLSTGGGSAPDAPAEIAYQDTLQMAVGVSTDPAFTLRAAHEQKVQAMRPDLAWNYAATRTDVLNLLGTSKPHLVYFYCHGGLSNNVPYLQVGPPNERGITRDNLRAKRILWDAPQPLVFINGCHTTAVEPEQALEMVSAFVENAQASGVIGTEITMFEPLARDFAEACLQRFLGGAPIGEAVRTARLALLKAGNPLGMAYIPFVIASLKLVKAG